MALKKDIKSTNSQEEVKTNRFVISDYMETHGHEQLVSFYDRETGLKAFTGIHNTNLGPALGGTRLWNYNNEDEAIEDVLRLSKGMSYKAASMDLPLGGGKTVVMGDVNEIRKDDNKRDEFFQALGRFVESLNGRYITAEDVNTTTDDMVSINKQTNHVLGLPNKSGNPSPITSLGCYMAMKAAAKNVFGTDSLDGRTIAVQGVGQTGYFLVKLILENENPKKIIFTTLGNKSKDRMLKEHPETVFVEKEEIYKQDVDIFSPCALGKVINKETINQLKAKIVVGTANNQLESASDGDLLFEKGIVYAPDYVSNGGGLINVFYEIVGYDDKLVKNHVGKIYNKIDEIIKVSKEKNIPEYIIADQLAEEKMKKSKIMKGIYLAKDASEAFIKNTTSKLGSKVIK